MRIITLSDVERLLPYKDCVEAMRKAMLAVSAGDVTLPIRQFMAIPDAPGSLALMPGTLGDPATFGIKLVCKYQRPPDSPYGTHVGMVMLFDAVEGLPLAMVEGSSLTGIRTAAASAMATDALARKDAKRLAILGCGEQAMRHIPAIQAVRDIEEVIIWGRNGDKAKSFAAEMAEQFSVTTKTGETVEDTISGADIICTTTSSKTPILSGNALPSGVHVNLVGSAIPTTAEADAAVVTSGRFFVDYRPAAMAAAGELLNAIKEGAATEATIAGEIGEVLSGKVEGRTSAEEITVYKSLGVSAQDLAASHIVYERAVAEGAGIEINMLD